MKWVVGDTGGQPLLFRGGRQWHSIVDFLVSGEIFWTGCTQRGAFITEERKRAALEAASADKFATLCQQFSSANKSHRLRDANPLFYVWKWGTTFGATTNLFGEEVGAAPRD